MKPACMSPDEFTSWAEQNQAVYQKNERATTPCHDCIASFAAEQRAIDRCDGEPCGTDDDDAPRTPSTAALIASAQVRHERRLHNMAVARHLSDMGLHQAAIARAMGKSASTVHHYLRDAA